MAVYSVSYDLNRPGQNYDGLIGELEKSPDWWHFLQSTWLIDTWESADTLWNRLSSHLDQSDRVLIIEVTDNFSGWLPEEAWTWIRQHVGRQPQQGALASYLQARR